MTETDQSDMEKARKIARKHHLRLECMCDIASLLTSERRRVLSDPRVNGLVALANTITIDRGPYQQNAKDVLKDFQELLKEAGE